MLATYGYEPDRESPSGLLLRNCPFHPLAARAPQTVCAINHSMLSGFLEALGAETVTAILEPVPGECCVRLLGTTG